ncbi:MAG: SAM-dependent methyltransferase [Methanolobus sp.]|nr:SAM-dependent methyltransferase [Methanolobus sp.]
MRLDAYLVETGCFRSRGRAKNAILTGCIRVDGVVVKKPSKDINAGADVDVEEGFDMPRGYFKLKRIQDATGIIVAGDRVLDLGSSAGGFLMLASEIAASVKGVEYSRDFMQDLEKVTRERENVSVILGDVFRIPLEDMSSEEVDVILSDITLEPVDSLAALERVLPLLKENGKLLQVIKTEKQQDHGPVLENIRSLGLEIIEVLGSEKQEIYIIAQKSIDGGSR